MIKKIKKVLVLGSGALKIGQAGEFDYSGSQALKALKEEGIATILINPNIATIQTSPSLADKIYFLPITPYFVEQVIKKEAPDAILLNSGGQTALNCGLELFRTKVLQKNNVMVLGTSIQTIEITEDRELFAKELAKIKVKVPRGGFATTLTEAKIWAKRLGFPLMIRSGFSLGGLGSSIVQSQLEFDQAVTVALKNAPQVSIEEYLKHWKEIEYEVVRDSSGNKITICNMENFDPLGVHTGESIVVAPSQTLNNYQYHLLRELSLKVIEQLQIVGECNIQFALDPRTNDYRVIEVNARLSRSSALASKATGYPLAYVAAKLCLGKLLVDLRNSVTRSTSAFFEPSLDYLVVKMPRWDLQKFVGAHDNIGSEMKSVGEVMAIGRSFPEALQKAIRMLENGQDGLINGYEQVAVGPSVRRDLFPSTKRLFEVAKELFDGVSVEKIYQLTGIDHWFLYQLEEIVECEKRLRLDKKLTKERLFQAKKLGFSDSIIAKTTKQTEDGVRKLRQKWGISPLVKQIDTLAGEYPAKTNYLYLTYHGQQSEIKPTKTQKVIVLGSGPYRIGSSVEFDWCAVTAALTLKQKGIETIMINCNPETVSTDYDIADKLYFEELSLERVRDIYEIEGQASLVLSFGGQVPNNLSLKAFKAGLDILGTSPLNIDRAEDRHKFSAPLDDLGIDQPHWKQLESKSQAQSFASKLGFPVLIRPSYVLSGSAMNIAYNQEELNRYLDDAVLVSREHPVVISKFIEQAKEIEIDGVADGGKLVIYALSEHVENAGVHSGDATLVLPPQRLYLETVRRIKKATTQMIQSLKITGPFNIQFMAKDNRVMVIELNLRSSRSFPFVSKVTGFNFVQIATKTMLGEHVKVDFNTLDLDYVGVKASQFSFNRIKGADPRLRVEMSSTGEVACFGQDLEEAYLKSLLATGFVIPQSSLFLSVGGDKNKASFLESAHKLSKLGLKIYATEGTSKFLTENGVKNTQIFKISTKKSPNVIELLTQGKVDLAINISLEDGKSSGQNDGFLIRRTCVDFNIPLITNLQTGQTLAKALSLKKLDDLEICSWDEYVR